MSDRPGSPAVAGLLHNFAPSRPFVTARSRVALEHVRNAYDDGRALVVLSSGWNLGSEYLVRRFLDGVGRGTVIAKVTESCQSETEGLRELIRSIDIEPKGIADVHLETVFVNFLAFQRTRKHRTILVMEESANNGGWVHIFIERLIKLEAEEKFGLTILLSRHTELNGLPDEVPLRILSYQTGKHVSLTPFTPTDTRDFIRWRIDATEAADLSPILDFEAITLIHELCDGVPDTIDRLYCASLELADVEDVAPITTDIVMQASRMLRLRPMTRQPGPNTQLRSAVPADIPTLKPPENAKVILCYKKAVISELPLQAQRISVGRSEQNDICINNRFVSREHAVIFRNGADTAIIDLDSKNGTYVNSHRVQVKTLNDRDEISIGMHTIRFVDSNATARLVDSNATARVSLNGVVQNRPSRMRSPKIAPNVLVEKARSRSETIPTLRKSALETD